MLDYRGVLSNGYGKTFINFQVKMDFFESTAAKFNEKFTIRHHQLKKERKICNAF